MNFFKPTAKTFVYLMLGMTAYAIPQQAEKQADPAKQQARTQRQQERAQQPQQAQPQQRQQSAPQSQQTRTQRQQERAQQPQQVQPQHTRTQRQQERAQQPQQVQPQQQQQNVQQPQQTRTQRQQERAQQPQQVQPQQQQQQNVRQRQGGQNGGYTPPQRSAQQAQAWQQNRGWRQHQGWQGRATFRENRTSNWAGEHRDWRQRGGYGGYYIPEARFGLYFGVGHSFRIRSEPYIVGGYPRFRYGGYSFMMVDPWPQDWGMNWYSSDDVYVGYDDGYYLFNRMHPGEGIAITVVM